MRLLLKCQNDVDYAHRALRRETCREQSAYLCYTSILPKVAKPSTSWDWHEQSISKTFLDTD
ncbi:hypothetical protein PR202_ga18129 [Eleusine coracana subsp. coracana]|uniref:Uncharacterized protein n=1 Tax=Eleusine coracana subsp. coracana TaxID=191504 RepID=A0AAV5CRW1_ELECO|nr:hypothetical protein PR202_ga18129 [Eleusine coracana subsp. coracana]